MSTKIGVNVPQKKSNWCFSFQFKKIKGQGAVYGCDGLGDGHIVTELQTVIFLSKTFYLPIKGINLLPKALSECGRD